MMQNDYSYVPSDADYKAWKHQVFGPLLNPNVVQEINLFLKGASPSQITFKARLIYAMTRLGSYGCTMWLFSDGMRFFPTHLDNGDGRLRYSPTLALTKAIIEFYLIPFFLRTPASRIRLPFYFATTGIGLVFVWNQIRKWLRRIVLGVFPNCREIELGILSHD